MGDTGGNRGAPIDLADLASTLQPFGQSRMLPRAAYVDPEVFAWEQREFFRSGWTCVGFGSELAQPGDQRAEPVGEGSVLLVRGEDGTLRAFANTCRHRGHELLPHGVTAQRHSIICPYHSWTYALSGGLHFASGLTGNDGFDQSGWGLVEIPVTEWHGLIFVNRSQNAGSLVESLQALDDAVTPYEPERLVIAGRHVYDSASNWKVVSENYQECYHCPAIHPELCRVSPPRSGVNFPMSGAWVGGWMYLREGMETMSLDGASLGKPLRGLDADSLRTVIYANIFPNVLLSLHPDYVMTHRLLPLAVDRTMIECTWAFPPEALDRPGFDPGYAVEFWDITNRQDFNACESVQRGLSSEHAMPGPLAPSEDGVYNFVTMVARGYQGKPVWSTAAAVS
ncbi:MAG: aromatic ring-hydroxylating oxygenase subunit alpha [Streptosporangiaceae bacterium]|jgi:Rieske 2Fe-2S family protein